MTKHELDITVIDDVSAEFLESAAVTQYPSPVASHPPEMGDEEKIAYIADKFQGIMEVLGLDLTDESLARTPERVARMYVKEIFSGLKPENFPTVSFIEDKYCHDEASNMVFVKVAFTSFCEHHFVPFHGAAYVAYRPNGKLIGLSKIHRIVRYFARRPQVQERLSAQIADCLVQVLETDDVAVCINAQHFCVVARGIEDDSSYTVTNVLRGEFNTDALLRTEFLEATQR